MLNVALSGANVTAWGPAVSEPDAVFDANMPPNTPDPTGWTVAGTAPDRRLLTPRGDVYAGEMDDRAAVPGGSSSALAVVACASAGDSQVSPLAPTLIPVPFGTVRYDPGNLWNAETFAFDIAEAGWYECGVFVESGSGITSDNCIPGGKIQVNGAGQNIVQAQYTPTPDAAAFGLPGWSGVTHLAIGDSVEVDLLSGSSVGTEEDPSLLTVIHLSFYISMIRAD